MQGNTPWRDYATDPPPRDCAVLVWLSEPVAWSQLHTMRTNVKGIAVIAGCFLFDLRAEILCWREIDEIADTVPLKYKKETS